MISYSLDPTIRFHSSLLYSLKIQESSFNCTSLLDSENNFRPININIICCPDADLISSKHSDLSSITINAFHGPKFLINYTFFLQLWALSIMVPLFMVHF